MCGIAGILSQAHQPPPDRAALESMAGRLAHRGPDGTGYLIDGPLGLAHTRLSVIDLATGQQPIHNEDRSVWVVFNGEIFNYLELRQTLLAQGHRFYTHSDTEVLVHLYEQHGEDFVHHLNGQFAVALWDGQARKLLLCRDHVGILPLFYAQNAGRLIFASEVKALLAIIDEAPRLNTAALGQIMTIWMPVGDATVFDGVSQIAPGTMLVVTDGDVACRRYWDWSFPTDDGYHEAPEARQAEELHALLLEATRLRLRADVPVGAYLSGGLDSSALAALIKLTGIDPVTYSIGFEDSSLDESSHQRQVIAHLGLRNHQVLCRNQDIGREFMRTVWHTETPVLRTAPVPMKMLSGLVHEHGCKVVLTGEGADEVLGGYDIFKEAKIRRFWARQPNSAWRPLLLKRLYPYLELSPSRSRSFSEAFFGIGLDHTDAPGFSHLPRWATTSQCKAFFSESLKTQLRVDAVNTLERGLPDAFSRWHVFNRAQYIEATTLMSNYLLCSQGDRMLMANSVEGRYPFLDQRVIAFASRLHPHVKMKVLREKYLLKKAMESSLPARIVARPKQPYRAPDIAAFFKDGAALDYVDALCSEETIGRCGYFDVQKTGLLLKKIRAGRAIGYRDNMAFVGILSTQAWHHLFIDNHNARAR